MTSTVIPLNRIARTRPVAPSGCGTAAGQGDLPAAVWNRIKDHPCYSEEAHHYFARMHVAVAPACNIQCNYCNRKYDCAGEARPGVTSEKLTPEQALRKVMAVAAKVPQLSVLGIAGPGDSLYDWRRTFETFRLVEKALPDIKFCLSTNGLALPDQVDRILDHNIDHVTVTVNMTDPEIGARIYRWVYFAGRRHVGADAARILHERQMEGIAALAARGVLVKINSVMIPGINDRHLAEVNAAVRARGAFLHNVLPLISDPAHGTWFGLNGQRGPTPDELADLQGRLAGEGRIMRHCRQCRADAIGLLGEDLSQDFTLDRIDPSAAYDPEAARLYREVVEREREARRGETLAARARLEAAAEDAPAVQVAVCTKGGGRINQHFGHAAEFQIFRVDRADVQFLGHRKIATYCQGGHGDDDKLEGILRALEGVQAVFVAKIGRCPRSDLAAVGIEAVDDHAFGYIENAVAQWYVRRFPKVRQKHG